MRRGICSRGLACDCTGDRTMLRTFCPDFQLEEEPPREVELEAIAHWQRLPEPQRIACLAALRLSVPMEVRAKWRDQAARGMRVGSEDPRFHFGPGMAVRNTLRRVLPDNVLPAVPYPDGGEHSNWDDYYYGALDALARGEAP